MVVLYVRTWKKQALDCAPIPYGKPILSLAKAHFFSIAGYPSLIWFHQHSASHGKGCAVYTSWSRSFQGISEQTAVLHTALRAKTTSYTVVLWCEYGPFLIPIPLSWLWQRARIQHMYDYILCSWDYRLSLARYHILPPYNWGNCVFAVISNRDWQTQAWGLSLSLSFCKHSHTYTWSVNILC